MPITCADLTPLASVVTDELPMLVLSEAEGWSPSR
jgi:hypothetical protein